MNVSRNILVLLLCAAPLSAQPYGNTNGITGSQTALLRQASSATAATRPASPAATLLSHDQLEHLIPATVFYKGQNGPTQLRNSAGLKLANGALVLAVKVDTGGYASADQEQYQDFLLAEMPLRFGGKVLPAGAYGVGFLNGNFVVMDIGGHELLSVPTVKDGQLKRPTPLNISTSAEGFRLYSGRDYIVLTPLAEGSR